LFAWCVCVSKAPEDLVAGALEWALWESRREPSSLDRFVDLFKSIASEYLKCEKASVTLSASEGGSPYIELSCVTRRGVEKYRIDLKGIHIRDKEVYIWAKTKRARLVE